MPVSAVNPICDVCGVEYVSGYTGPCQEPRPPYDGTRTCPGTVSVEAALLDLLEGVRIGHIIRDETEEGTPILLDLRTNPASPILYTR